MRKFLVAVCVLSSVLFFSNDSTAKVKFKFNKSKKIKLMQAYVSSNGVASSASRRSNRVKQGEKIYFYYKLGPIASQKRKGAPYKTKLVIKYNNRVIKDFGWHHGNVTPKNRRNVNGSYKWFHTAAWNLVVPRIKPGNYVAYIYHTDVNSRKTIQIRYPLVVLGDHGPGVQNDNTGGVRDFIRAVKSYDRRIMRSYFVSNKISYVDNKRVRGMIPVSRVLRELYKNSKYIKEGAPLSVRRKSSSKVMISSPPYQYYFYFRKNRSGKVFIWRYERLLTDDAREPGL